MKIKSFAERKRLNQAKIEGKQLGGWLLVGRQHQNGGQEGIQINRVARSTEQVAWRSGLRKNPNRKSERSAAQKS